MVMKQINEYINENLETRLINEGAIWKAIKNWFKKLFSSEDNDYLFYKTRRKYDRFNYDSKDSKDKGKNSITQNKEEYQKYLKSNFSFKFLSLTSKKPSLVKELIDKHNELNFQVDEKHKYFLGFFWNKSVKDLVYVIDGYLDKSDIYFITNIYIINEYKKYITIKDTIDILLNDKKEVTFINREEFTEVFIKEKDNKELYKHLIKECGFVEEKSKGLACKKKSSDSVKDNKKEDKKILNKI